MYFSTICVVLLTIRGVNGAVPTPTNTDALLPKGVAASLQNAALLHRDEQLYAIGSQPATVNPCKSGEYFCGRDGDCKAAGLIGAAWCCLSPDKLCDGIKDCLSNEVHDEMCQKGGHCDAGYFGCNNGLCVGDNLRCNGVDDCQDMSDEQGCPSKPTVAHYDCAPNEYKCFMGPCIPMEFVCDKTIAHCPHKEDESNCPSVGTGCFGNEFVCFDNLKCVPEQWKCDGSEDCADGSDEMHCNLDPYLPALDDYSSHKHLTISCSTSEFMCGIEGACISRSLLCDGTDDCSDASDEGGFCGTCDTFGCSDTCIDGPLYTTCACNKGRVLMEDKKTCVDVDECLMGMDHCDHYCINHDGGYSCTCAYGFHGGSMCSLKKENKIGQIIFTYGHQMRSLPLFPVPGGIVEDISDASLDMLPVSVDFSFPNDFLYTAAEERQGTIGTIYQYNLALNQSAEMCLVEGLPGVTSVAVDWVTSNLYYAVGSPNEYPGIGVCSSDGRYCKLILTSHLYGKPNGLTLHPARGKMYWAIAGMAPAIYEACMDGTDPKIVVDTKLYHVGGVTIDRVRNVLYWSDVELNIIESIHLATHTRHIVVSKGVGVYRPFDLMYFNQHLFWTSGSSVVSAHLWRNETEDVRVLSSPPLNPIAVTVVNSAVQDLEMSNPCDTMPCSHLCVISINAPQQAKCICPTDYYIMSDQLTCRYNQTSVTPQRPWMCQSSMMSLCNDDLACVHGLCSVDNKRHVCVCESGYSGEYCEIYASELERSTDGGTGWIVAVTLIVIFLTIAGILVAVYIRNSDNMGPKGRSLGVLLSKSPVVMFMRRGDDPESQRMVEDEPPGSPKSFNNPLYQATTTPLNSSQDSGLDQSLTNNDLFERISEQRNPYANTIHPKV